RAGNGRDGERHVFAFAEGVIRQRRARQRFDEIVRRGASAVEPLVNDHALFIELRVKIALEQAVTALPCVWQEDVGQLAARRFLDFAPVVFSPIHQTQRVFAGQWNDGEDG